MRKIIHLIRTLLCLPIYFYQYVISPWMKPACRFSPSCSQYALLAINHHGVFKGGFLATWRILRCHPWTHGGYDPIIPNKEKN